jgi:hypothetical protein
MGRGWAVTHYDDGLLLLLMKATIRELKKLREPKELKKLFKFPQFPEFL